LKKTIPNGKVPSGSPALGTGAEDEDPLAQKNKLLNALDGFGFQTPKRKNSDAAKIERVYYLVTVWLNLFLFHIYKAF
jgi:hypothetical protein